LFDGSRNGFVMGLPSFWLDFNLTEGDIDTIADEVATYSEEDAELIRQMADAGAEIVLFAMGPSGDPNLNIVILPLGPFDTIELLEVELEQQIEMLPGATVLSISRFEVSGADALRVVATITLPEGTPEQHQYYVLTEDIGFIITFLTLNPVQDRDTFDTVMETFTLVDE
jgi:hypothetical protein